MDYRQTRLELFWVSLQPLLLKRGYKLRPRFDPYWEPSWLQRRADGTFPSLSSCEDRLPGGRIVMDGTRTADGQKVIFKIVETDKEEIPIAQLLSSAEMKADPRNRSVPILDVILIPGNDDEALMVMPQLLVMDHLPFRRLGELCEAASQILDGFEFIHEQNICHRDVCIANITMDVSKVIPKGYHLFNPSSHDGVRFGLEWKTRWSVRPNHYYIIDYGLSHQCMSKSETVLAVLCQDRSVPEMSSTVPYDPFKADVYQIGSIFKELMRDYVGLEVFTDFVDKITIKDAAARPSAADAVKLFRELVKELESKKMMQKRVWKVTGREKRFELDWLERFFVTWFCYNPLA